MKKILFGLIFYICFYSISYSCEINQHGSEGRFKLKINSADAYLIEKCYKEFIIKEKAKGQKAFVLIQGTAYQDEALIFSSKYNIADAKDNGYLFFISYYSSKPGYRVTNNGTLIMVNDDRVTEINKTADVPKIERPVDNTKVNTVIKSEKVSKSENEERKTNIITNKNAKLSDSQFSKKCEGGVFSKGYKKGTEEFNDCVKREEKLAALDVQKRELMNEEKNKKIALEENKKQKAIQQKRELDSAKIKEEQIKLSKMKPEDRHAYTCAEKFDFRKGSDKFKDCVFELYKVETELEKLELQKKIIETNLELAKTRESAARSEQDRNNALLERQTLAQERTAAAAAQQARIANFESSQRMIDDGLALMRGDRNLAGQVRQPQQRLQTNCTFTGRFMSCF